MKKSAVMVTLGLLLMLAPRPAYSDDLANGIFGTLAVGGGLSILCMTFMIGADETEGDEEDMARIGPELALGANVAMGPLTQGSNAINSSYGLHAYAGYRCHRRLATDVEVEYLAGYSYQGLDADPWVITTNSRYFFLTGRLQPYLRIGGGLYSATVRGSGEPFEARAFAMRLGTGLDFYLTRNLMINAKLDWVKPLAAVSQLDYLTLGTSLGYRF